MALGPKSIQDQNKNEADRLEALIDQKIAAGKTRISLQETPNLDVQEILKERYKRAGWKTAKFERVQDDKDCRTASILYFILSQSPDLEGRSSFYR